MRVDPVLRDILAPMPLWKLRALHRVAKKRARFLFRNPHRMIQLGYAIRAARRPPT